MSQLSNILLFCCFKIILTIYILSCSSSIIISCSKSYRKLTFKLRFFCICFFFLIALKYSVETKKE